MAKISVTGGATTSTPTQRTWTAAGLAARPVATDGVHNPSALVHTPQVGDILKPEDVPPCCTIF